MVTTWGRMLFWKDRRGSAGHPGPTRRRPLDAPHLQHRQGPVLAIAGAHHDLQVWLRTVLKLHGAGAGVRAGPLLCSLPRPAVCPPPPVGTSSERKAGSPMAALAQGPMLRMLSHTCGHGSGQEAGWPGPGNHSEPHLTSKEYVASCVPDCASLPYTSISSTSSCGTDLLPGA
mgnify:CR=1 FL=1